MDIDDAIITAATLMQHPEEIHGVMGKPGQLQDISRAAAHLAQQAAFLAGYCDARGAAGSGDSGHDAALSHAQTASKKVRKALGFTYP